MGTSTHNVLLKRGGRFALAALGALVLAAGLFSACNKTRGPAYLTWTELSRLPMAPPPENSSEGEKADFSVLSQWQAKRTGGQCSAASAETTIKFKTMFGKLHPFKTPVSPAVKLLFKNANRDAEMASILFKSRYRRDRPFTRDGAIRPCITKPSGYSYPSGHATTARLYARILADLDPKCAALYVTRADEISLNRVIGGVHYPSDIDAGKQLADEVYAALQKNPAFQKDMAAARPFATQPCQR